jgi:transcriptional regulator with XRE-family HTH domain
MVATEKDLKALGKEMGRMRTAKNLSKTDLARKLGISTKQIDHVENGVNWPSMKVYIGLCRVLGVEQIPMVPLAA